MHTQNVRAPSLSHQHELMYELLNLMLARKIGFWFVWLFKHEKNYGTVNHD